MYIQDSIYLSLNSEFADATDRIYPELYISANLTTSI